MVIQRDAITLLGKQSAISLGLLRVGPQVSHVNNYPESRDSIISRYKDLFTGVGLLKDYSVHLHIDKSIKPVAQPMRRTPLRLRETVDEKLDELLTYDIIEPVTNGPTRWVSPLVVAPKPDGDVLVCVDLRRANEAIVRERHPMPTVEDLLHDINGSIVFSKLDLKWSFNQVMYDEASRDKTTFVTHRGLFRYKRLMFGLCSTPEKYNKIIHDVLKNCQGCANISDDVIVYGKTLAEHDKI